MSKLIKLYSLNTCDLLDVNYISIKLFNKKEILVIAITPSLVNPVPQVVITGSESTLSSRLNWFSLV